MAGTLLGVHLLVWFLTLAVADGKAPEVRMMTCLLYEDCKLPCYFQPLKDWAITWSKQEVVVYSLHTGSDRLQQHAPQYSNRAAVSREQAANGDASLLLRHCTLEDKGRYRCRVNNTEGVQDSIVILRVEAPVQSVSLQMAQHGHRQMNCSSKDIYPAPHLQWSADPPLSLHALRATTNKVANTEGLYAIQSMLDLVKNFSEYTYICTVIAAYGTKTWRVSLKETDMSAVQGKALTIPCFAPANMSNFNLTWAFIEAGKPSAFFMFNSQTGRMTNSWTERAKVDPAKARSGDGSLQLRDMHGNEVRGTYLCNFSAIHTTHLVYTNVHMTAKATGQSYARVGVILGIIVVLILLGAALLVYAKMKDDHDSEKRLPRNGEESNETPIAMSC